MIRATQVRPQHRWTQAPADSVVLDFDDRHRRRMAMRCTRGLEFLLDLENATVLRGGDALVLDDNRLIEVVAAPELLIEISARPPILAPVICGYDTIVNEMLGRAERTGTIACLNIRETTAGKNAALLRRWSARLRGTDRAFELGNVRDEDIVRHIYDLGRIFEQFPQELVDAEVGQLARQMLLQDAEEFGSQDPGFKEAPIERALDAVNDLVKSAEAKLWYERFSAAMVYGAIPAFDESMGRILKFADAWAPAGA